VIGAYEVPTEPALDLHAPLQALSVEGKPEDSAREERWKEAQELWHDLKLRQSFVEAADGVPVETCCCGLCTDDTETLKKLIPHLNDTWCKHVNEKLLKQHNLRVDCFLWHWTNISGSTETRVLLIRFHDEGASGKMTATRED
jgi:hypothetical protein